VCIVGSSTGCRVSEAPPTPRSTDPQIRMGLRLLQTPTSTAAAPKYKRCVSVFCFSHFVRAAQSYVLCVVAHFEPVLQLATGFFRGDRCFLFFPSSEPSSSGPPICTFSSDTDCRHWVNWRCSPLLLLRIFVDSKQRSKELAIAIASPDE